MRILLAAGLLATAAIGARAADLDSAPADFAPPAVQQLELGTGWYLRGAVGYAFEGSLIASMPVLGSASLKEKTHVNGDIAVGYQFNAWLRGDVSLDMGQSKAASSPFSVPGSGNVTIAGDRRGLLANLFVDLGTWNKVTPYIGFGYGLVRTSFGSDIDLAPPTLTLGQNHSTWALMAGLAYNFDRNLKIELGYRYIDYGQFHVSYAPMAYVLQTNPNRQQQIRVGVRYMID